MPAPSPGLPAGWCCPHLPAARRGTRRHAAASPARMESRLCSGPPARRPRPQAGEPQERGRRGAGGGLCPAALTLLQRRLDGKSGLMSAPKPAMLSSVPDGRLFRATSKASWGDSGDRGGLLRTGHPGSIPGPAAVPHLHLVKVGAAHGAAAVDEEEDLAGDAL